MAMPKDKIQLKEWYRAYNEVMKKRAIARWNCKFWKFYHINATIENPCNRSEVEALYVDNYFESVFCCPHYKGQIMHDLPAITKEAFCALQRINRKILKLEKVKKQQTSGEDDGRDPAAVI